MTTKKVLKYLLFTFNLLFFIGGCILLAFSVHIKRNKADYQLTDELLPGVNLLIFVGAVTMIFGFLGFCGAIRENRCLLAMFFTGLLSMFLMLLTVGMLGAIARTAAAQALVKENMQQLLPLSDQTKEVQESHQAVERNGFCCGLFDGHLDWGSSTMVPDSCNCTDTSRNCTALGGREVYSTPCMTYVMTWMDRTSDTLIGTAVTFGVLMILGMILSLVMMCRIVRERGII